MERKYGDCCYVRRAGIGRDVMVAATDAEAEALAWSNDAAWVCVPDLAVANHFGVASICFARDFDHPREP